MMSLFVMLFSQAWALQPVEPPVDPKPKVTLEQLKHAIITFEVEGRTVIFDCEDVANRKGEGDRVQFGYFPTQHQIDKANFEDDKLWMTYTGKLLKPTVKSIVVGKGEDAVDVYASGDVEVSYMGNLRWATETAWPSNEKQNGIQLTIVEEEIAHGGKPGGGAGGNNEEKTLLIEFPIKKAWLNLNLTMKPEYEPLYVVIEPYKEANRYYNGTDITAAEFTIAPEFEGHEFKDFAVKVDVAFTQEGFAAYVTNPVVTDAVCGVLPLTEDNEFDETGEYVYPHNQSGDPIDIYLSNFYNVDPKNHEGWPSGYLSGQTIPLPVTLAISGNVNPEEGQTLYYDGTEKFVKGFTFTPQAKVIDPSLLDKDIWEEDQFVEWKEGDSPIASGKDADRYTMGLSAEDFHLAKAVEKKFVIEDPETDVTIVRDGLLTISPLEGVVVKVLGNSAEKTYDATEQKAVGYTTVIENDNSLYTENDFVFNGEAVAKRTEPGTTWMELKDKMFENTSSNFKDVQFVIDQDGYIKITKADVTVTITGNHKGGGVDGDNDWVYFDDALHTVTGYTWKADNELYKEADFTFSGEAKVQSKKLGQNMMKLKKDQFENTNANFNVDFKINDGYLWITYFQAVLDAEAEDGVAKVINKVVGTYASKADVTVLRTFATGKWYTICLPFNVDLTAVDCPLADAEVREMSKAEYGDGVMTLDFEKVDEMEAGKPYVINFTAPHDAITFNAVTASKVLTDVTVGSVTFKGTYTPVEFEENKSVLLVGDNNNLFYPKNAYVNSLRGYFLLDGIEASDLEEESAPAFVLNFGGTTNISNVNMEKASNEYFDLSGRRVVGQPTERGIYIMNGKKVVVK